MDLKIFVAAVANIRENTLHALKYLYEYENTRRFWLLQFDSL